MTKKRKAKIDWGRVWIEYSQYFDPDAWITKTCRDKIQQLVEKELARVPNKD